MQGLGRAPGLELFLATVRSALASLDQLAEERNRLLEAFKRQWSGDRVIQACARSRVSVSEVSPRVHVQLGQV